MRHYAFHKGSHIKFRVFSSHAASIRPKRLIYGSSTRLLSLYGKRQDFVHQPCAEVAGAFPKTASRRPAAIALKRAMFTIELCYRDEVLICFVAGSRDISPRMKGAGVVIRMMVKEVDKRVITSVWRVSDHRWMGESHSTS